MVAVFALADEVRATASAAVQALIDMDVTPVMITGDAEAVARTVAAELGIERFYARVLPDEKAKIVESLQNDAKVAFVGDGINDAPSLLHADLGIAIGAGTNVAIESADLVLIDTETPSTVSKENIEYKCGWSPFEGVTFKTSIAATWVNGQLAYTDGQVNDTVRGQRLLFDR